MDVRLLFGSPHRAGHADEIAEAREALAFWSARSRKLAWHRRAARREAREMALRWRGRLVVAHLERWGLGGPVAVAAVQPLVRTVGPGFVTRVMRLAFRWMRRTHLGRWIIVMSAATA